MIRFSKWALYFVTLLYLSFLFYIFFIRVIGTDRSTYFVNPDDHFVPFNSTTNMVRKVRADGLRSQASEVLIINVVGNLILFVPLGLLLPTYHRWFDNWKRLLVVSILFSGFVECVQFLFSIGIFDIDDIIYNTCGAFIGFLGFQLLSVVLGYKANPLKNNVAR